MKYVDIDLIYMLCFCCYMLCFCCPMFVLFVLYAFVLFRL